MAVVTSSTWHESCIINRMTASLTFILCLHSSHHSLAGRRRGAEVELGILER